MKKLALTIYLLVFLFSSHTLTAQAPVANFRLSDTIGGFLDQIQCTNLSTGSPTSYRWNINPLYFGMHTFAGLVIANTWSNDTVQSPSLLLFDAGVFNVCLKVTNSFGTDSVCKQSCLKVVDGYMMCNGSDSVSALSEGFVYDAGGPTGNYYYNSTGACSSGFRIAACADSVILYVKRFRLLTGDTLRIRKNGPTGLIIKTLVGSNLPDSLKTIRIAGNVFFQMKLTNTSASGDSGFAVYWKATSAGVGYTVNNNMQTLTGNSFVFADTTSGGSSRVWSFGDLTGSTSLSPTKNYLDSGVYQVKLVTTKYSGCKDSVTKTVTVLTDPPTTSASGLTFSSITNSGMHLAWTNGNGSNRIVIAKAGSAVNFTPQNGSGYSSSPIFTSGTTLGSGNKVIYNGTGNNVTVSGLSISSAYFFAVVEFNGGPGLYSYQSTPYLTGNKTTLPVKLISFTAECNRENKVQLHWVTASEANNDYFEIERSRENIEWNTIGKVKGNGTTNSMSHYQFTDKGVSLSGVGDLQLLTSNLYYRLKQTDFDGTSSYSDVKVVELKNLSNSSVQIVYQNNVPFVKCNSSVNDHIKLQLYSISGILLWQSNADVQQGMNLIAVEKEFSNGLYVLRTQTSDEVKRFKILMR